jgi:hypothetical protein
MVSEPRNISRRSLAEHSAHDRASLFWLAPLLLSALPFFARFDLLFIPLALQVDEAQWTVTARSALTDPILWRSIDMQTSGPLNALPISWPILFGAVPSLFTSRLTGLLLQSLCILGIASLIRPKEILSPGFAAVLIIAFRVTFLVLPDHVHYSSELLSLALIVAAAVLLVRAPDGLSAGPRLAFCGLIASCLPFAKLQSAPFFVLIHAVCLTRLAMGVRAKQAGLSDVVMYLFAAVVPALLLVAPLFFVGEQDAFLIGYLGLGRGYGGVRTLEIFRQVWTFMAIMGVLVIAVCLRYRDPVQRARSRPDLLALSLGLWPAALMAIWFPGRLFWHYQFYAIIGLPLSVVLAQRSLPPLARQGSASWLSLVTFAVAVFVSAGIVAHGTPNALRLLRVVEMEQAFAPEGSGATWRPLLAWTGATADDTVLMWGWVPELTAYSGMRSADRAAVSQLMMSPNVGKVYYRERLLKELQQTDPAIMIDASREGYFFTNDPGFDPHASDLRSFPQLYALVSKDYERVAGDDRRCAAIYLRRDKAVALRAAEIPLRSSIQALVDGPGTETCGDWWAPETPTAQAEFNLDPAKPIGELWILPSRGGPDPGGDKHPRGSARVQITFLTPAGGKNKMIVQLHDYPDWTVIKPPESGPIEKIEIETLEFVGEGPALAGVKAFKAGW